MASKSADNGTVPPELDPLSGCPLLSRPTPLPEQAHSQLLSRPRAAGRARLLEHAGNIDRGFPRTMTRLHAKVSLQG
jgi:hypothetical protein